MSDVVRSSTTNIAELVDEIISQRPVRPRQSSYAGLRHKTSARKYRDCEFVQQGFGRVRKLTTREVEEFQAHVWRCMEARS